MKKHLIFILIFIIVVPIWTISLIWNTTMENENDALRYRFGKVMEGRLRDFMDGPAKEMAPIAQNLVKETNFSGEMVEAVRALKQADPLVLQVLIIDAEGRVLPPEPARSDQEDKSLDGIYLIARDLLSAPGKSAQNDSSAPNALPYGWHTQFGSQGLRLFFWRKLSTGNLIVVELNRPALLSSLIAKLPKADPSFRDAVVLSGESGQLLYVWGDIDLLKNSASSQISLALDYPLNTLNLHYFAHDDLVVDMKFHSLILAIASSLFILGGYFFREHMRAIDDTAQKVTFVNQVSHELKTPLTNIRLYADLLKERFDGNDDAMEKVGVIESESRRLSRLINNVLAFSSKNHIRVNPHKCNVRELINKVIENFRPGLEKKGVAIDINCTAEEAIVDSDILEQILINLIGNVEKYAADGKYIGIKAFHDAGRLHVRVEDRGHGIPEKMKKKIFKPFVRIHESTTEGVSGTGIGLSLSKDLAARHGGELSLVPSETGACFEVIL